MSYLDMSVKELEQRLEDFKAEIAAEPHRQYAAGARLREDS
jgi:hypothetical protein